MLPFGITFPTNFTTPSVPFTLLNPSEAAARNLQSADAASGEEASGFSD